MIEIVRHGLDIVDELRPLWLAMVHHHAEVAPGLGPVFEDDRTWAMRRAHYDAWLREDDAFVLVARDGDEAVGYALVTVGPGSATWSEPERAGTIESLAILPHARGAGLGRRLVEAVEEELAKLGIIETRLSVVAENAPALAFYERIGFEPIWVTLRRRAG